MRMSFETWHVLAHMGELHAKVGNPAVAAHFGAELRHIKIRAALEKSRAMGGPDDRGGFVAMGQPFGVHGVKVMFDQRMDLGGIPTVSQPQTSQPGLRGVGHKQQMMPVFLKAKAQERMGTGVNLSSDGGQPSERFVRFGQCGFGVGFFS